MIGDLLIEISRYMDQAYTSRLKIDPVLRQSRVRISSKSRHKHYDASLA